MPERAADSHGQTPNDFQLSPHGRTKRTASAAGLDSAESRQPREESFHVNNRSASGSDDNESDGGHDSRRTSTPEGVDAGMQVAAAVMPPAARKNEEVSPLKYFEVADGVSDVKFGCSVCGLLYKWRKSLNKHWSTNHKGHPGDDLSIPEGMKILLADSDYKQTGNRRCCSESLLEGLAVAPNATEEGLISGLFQCTQCSFHAGGPYEVIYHFKQLHEDKPHACNSCLYRTKWKHDLRKHQFICKGRLSEELKGSNDLEKQLLMSSVKRRLASKVQNRLHRGEEAPTLTCSQCPFRCQDAREMEQHYIACHYQVPIDLSHPYSIHSVPKAEIAKPSPLRPFVDIFNLKPFGFDALSPVAHNLFASYAAPAPTTVSEPGPCFSRRVSSPLHRPWESSSFEDSLLTPYNDTVSKASSPDKLLPLDLSLKNGEHVFNDSAISSLMSSPSLQLSLKRSMDDSKDTAMSSMTSPPGLNLTANTDGNTSDDKDSLQKITPSVGSSPSNDIDKFSHNSSGSTQTTMPISRVYNCKHCPFTISSMTSFEFRRHCRSFHGIPGQYGCDYCNYSHKVLFNLIQHRLLHSHLPGFNVWFHPQSREHSPEPRLQP